MAYGQKYTAEFTSFKGKKYFLVIEQDGYAGPVTELELAGNPVEIEWGDSGDDAQYTHIVPSTMQVRALGRFGSELRELSTGGEYEYRTFLRETSVLGSTFWYGFPLDRTFEDFPREPVGEVGFRAYDGLGTLKGRTPSTLNDAGTMIDLIERGLSLLTLDGTGPTDIEYVCNFYPWLPSDETPILNTLREIEVPAGWNDRAGLDAYETIESVLIAFDLQLFQMDGKWFLTQRNPFQQTDQGVDAPSVFRKAIGGSYTELNDCFDEWVYPESDYTKLTTVRRRRTQGYTSVTGTYSVAQPLGPLEKGFEDGGFESPFSETAWDNTFGDVRVQNNVNNFKSQTQSDRWHVEATTDNTGSTDNTFLEQRIQFLLLSEDLERMEFTALAQFLGDSGSNVHPVAITEKPVASMAQGDLYVLDPKYSPSGGPYYPGDGVTINISTPNGDGFGRYIGDGGQTLDTGTVWLPAGTRVPFYNSTFTYSVLTLTQDAYYGDTSLTGDLSADVNDVGGSWFMSAGFWTEAPTINTADDISNNVYPDEDQVQQQVRFPVSNNNPNGDPVPKQAFYFTTYVSRNDSTSDTMRLDDLDIQRFRGQESLMRGRKRTETLSGRSVIREQEVEPPTYIGTPPTFGYRINLRERISNTPLYNDEGFGWRETDIFATNDDPNYFTLQRLKLRTRLNWVQYQQQIREMDIRLTDPENTPIGPATIFEYTNEDDDSTELLWPMQLRWRVRDDIIEGRWQFVPPADDTLTTTSTVEESDE